MTMLYEFFVALGTILFNHQNSFLDCVLHDGHNCADALLFLAIIISVSFFASYLIIFKKYSSIDHAIYALLIYTPLSLIPIIGGMLVFESENGENVFEYLMQTQYVRTYGYTLVNVVITLVAVAVLIIKLLRFLVGFMQQKKWWLAGAVFSAASCGILGLYTVLLIFVLCNLSTIHIVTVWFFALILCLCLPICVFVMMKKRNMTLYAMLMSQVGIFVGCISGAIAGSFGFRFDLFFMYGWLDETIWLSSYTTRFQGGSILACVMMAFFGCVLASALCVISEIIRRKPSKDVERDIEKKPRIKLLTLMKRGKKKRKNAVKTADKVKKVMLPGFEIREENLADEDESESELEFESKKEIPCFVKTLGRISIQILFWLMCFALMLIYGYVYRVITPDDFLQVLPPILFFAIIYIAIFAYLTKFKNSIWTNVLIILLVDVLAVSGAVYLDSGSMLAFYLPLGAVARAVVMGIEITMVNIIGMYALPYALTFINKIKIGT